MRQVHGGMMKSTRWPRGGSRKREARPCGPAAGQTFLDILIPHISAIGRSFLSRWGILGDHSVEMLPAIEVAIVNQGPGDLSMRSSTVESGACKWPRLRVEMSVARFLSLVVSGVILTCFQCPSERGHSIASIQAKGAPNLAMPVLHHRRPSRLPSPPSALQHL